MNAKDIEFMHFIGSIAVEDDESWSKEVWDAAWQAAVKFMQQNAEKLK